MSDGPMTRKLFVEMNVQEQGEYLLLLQSRRLVAVTQYQQAQAALAAAEKSRVADKLRDQLRMIDRDLASVERALDKVEGRWTKINALRAMMEA